MPTTRPRPARARILAAAAELFYKRGITATGIDTVIEHAGVARKSLYNNFASKDDLVTDYIQARHDQWIDLYRQRVDSGGTSPDTDASSPENLPTPGDTRVGVMAVVDAYIDHATADGDHFRGCGLLNTAAEFPPDSESRATVRRHKEQVEDLLASALSIGHPDTAAATAVQISFLLEGAVTRAGLEGSPARLHEARDIIGALLDALPNTPPDTRP